MIRLIYKAPTAHNAYRITSDSNIYTYQSVQERYIRVGRFEGDLVEAFLAIPANSKRLLDPMEF